MAYTAKSVSVDAVTKATLMTTFVRQELFPTTTSYQSLFDGEVDLTDIDTIHMTITQGGQAGDARLDIDTVTTDKALAASTNHHETWDVSSNTGTVHMKIQLKNDVAANNTKIACWGTKG